MNSEWMVGFVNAVPSSHKDWKPKPAYFVYRIEFSEEPTDWEQPQIKVMVRIDQHLSNYWDTVFYRCQAQPTYYFFDVEEAYDRAHYLNSDKSYKPYIFKRLTKPYSWEYPDEVNQKDMSGTFEQIIK